MKGGFTCFLGCLLLGFAHLTFAEGSDMTMDLPKSVEAGAAFSIPTTGSGKAALYIVGPGQVLRREVQLGETTIFPAGGLYNAGRYVAILVAGSAEQSGVIDVMPGTKPASLSFLAKPSRLPVGLHDGISGAVYVFDAYHNLITAPTPVSFHLSNGATPAVTQTVTTRDGAAWIQMDSAAKEGSANFVAQADGVSSTRVIEEVPGDPCGLVMSAKQVGHYLDLQTNPLRDCSGNSVPDGTIVTFTEAYDGMQSTVDVPLKHGVAEVEMPAAEGARISVASGVVMGNEIHWGGGR